MKNKCFPFFDTTGNWYVKKKHIPNSRKTLNKQIYNEKKQTQNSWCRSWLDNNMSQKKVDSSLWIRTLQLLHTNTQRGQTSMSNVYRSMHSITFLLFFFSCYSWKKMLTTTCKYYQMISGVDEKIDIEKRYRMRNGWHRVQLLECAK